MRRRTSTHAITVVLGTALATIVAAGTPAAADTVRFRDDRGDAPARHDLTSVRVANTDAAVTVAARVVDLRGGRAQIFGFQVTPTRSTASYMLETARYPGGRTTAQLTGYDGNQSIKVDCDLVRTWRPARDTIKVSFARRCLEPGPLRVRLLIGAGDGRSGDPADWTRSVRVAQG